MIEHEGILRKNTNIGTVNVQLTWSVTLDIKPLGFVSDWASIVHFTIGDNMGKPGDRIPGLWFWPGTTKLHVTSYLSGKSNHYDSIDKTRAVEMNKWSTIKMQQIKDGSTYKLEYFLNSELISSVPNRTPMAFDNVAVYAADPWYKAANAKIRRLRYNSCQYQ